jgi:hypothetical protein
VRCSRLNLAGTVPGFDLVNVQVLNQGSAAGKLAFETANFSINENGTPVTEVNIIRTDGSYGQVSATINLTNGTAITPSDYTNTPITVNFANGETSKTVTIPIVNDTQFETDETVNLTLSNPTGGAILGTQTTATLTIVDNDLPMVSLAVSPARVIEDGTTNLIYTFTRNGVISNPLTVNYTVGGTATFNTDYTQSGAASFTSTTGTVTFAANATTATVTVDPTADTTVENDETVALTLTTGTGYTIGTTTAVTGTITNDDLPSITLAVSPSSVTEDGTTNLVYTFTRTGVTTNALTVNYSVGGTATNGTDYTSIPTSVTFAAGSSTATVTVDPTADTTVENDETVALTLTTGTGYTIGTTTAVTGTITGDDTINVADLQITNLAATTNPIYTGKQSYLTYKVENKGLAPASGTWTDKVYLSTDNKFDSSDSLITETTFTPSIPFNSFYERNIPFFAPKNGGQYYLIATTDANNTVNEGTGLGEQNNTVITPITVIPAYKATVYTDTVIGTNRQAVTLRGNAVNNADNSPVPFEFVTIRIENNGTIRELSAFTDGNGNFVKSFNPLPTEGGQYNINAYFPNNPTEDTAPEDSFKLLGMKFNTSQVTNKVIADTPFTGTVTLENITNIGITGITATVDSVVPGWNVQVNTPQNLAGSGNNTLSYTITAPNDSYITQDTFIAILGAMRYNGKQIDK